jgi:hypothetical protein
MPGSVSIRIRLGFNSAPGGVLAAADGGGSDYDINLSTSSFVGSDGCAPNLVQASAPQAHP